MSTSVTLDLPGVPPELLPLLCSAAQGQRVALVGGAVRDWLLHRVHNDPWRGLIDLDLVVEGSAVAFVEQLGSELRKRSAAGAVDVDFALVAAQEHGAYGTVELELRVAGQTVLLDVATARSETYPQLGENPVVAFGSLEDDLRRRDFSINAMAVLLAPLSASSSADVMLLDPYGGQQDLERRQLRFLHGGSVADDPTRLVRGARYAARLGFALAPKAFEQARNTLATWPWDWRPGYAPGQAPSALGTRLRMELELLLEREPWPDALLTLQTFGGLLLLDSELQCDRTWFKRLRWAERFGVPLLSALLAAASDPLAVAERLQVPHRHHKLLAQWLELRQRWRQCLIDDGPQSLGLQQGDANVWSCWLEMPGSSSDAVALELVAGLGAQHSGDQDQLPRRPLLRWWLRWRHLKASVTAVELMTAEGLKPGPLVGERLRQLRAIRLAEERS